MHDIYADLQSICPVSRETMERLDHFVGLFSKWSKSVNLVAPSTLPDIWNRHVADSLQIFSLNPGPNRWLDLGSGGGFPGIITAIMLLQTEGGYVDLVESNHKKAAFLRMALIETGARGTVHAIRVEEAGLRLSGQRAISARALAELDTLLSMTLSWTASGAQAWFHKGRDYSREIEKARRSWTFDLIEHRSKVDAESVILQIDRVQRRATDGEP